jgi:hypothetical protein
MKDNYLKDLIDYINAIPYGEINVVVRKVNRNVVQITTEGSETLRYNPDDETDPRLDVNLMLDNLQTTSYSGEVSIKLDYTDGIIRLVTVYDKKQTKY